MWNISINALFDGFPGILRRQRLATPMISEESTFDLLTNFEAAWSMPPQAVALLVLILLLMGWGMWEGWRDERRGNR